jgi:UDP-N-acetylglucosamine 2-epimerase
MRRLLTVVGTRPQLIKYAAVFRPLRAAFDEVLVDTGQHYDRNLAGVFFEELELPKPRHVLFPRPGSVTAQLGDFVSELGRIIEAERPDLLLCFGDTTSTLAAALAAVKLGVPVAHVESGERNFRADGTRVAPRSIPEETNRVVADHLSALRLCASRRAVDNLAAEGIAEGVVFTGDILADLFRQHVERLTARSRICDELGVAPGEYVYATCHRALNTDDPARLAAIIEGLGRLDRPVVLPLHPRTRKMLLQFGLADRLAAQRNVRAVDPVGYADSLALGRSAWRIVTDSGGLVREAFFHGVPSVLIDDTTEWIDLVTSGWSSIAGADPEAIVEGVTRPRPTERPDPFGQGDSVAATIEALQQCSR